MTPQQTPNAVNGNPLSPRQSNKQREEFEAMLAEVKTRLEDKLRLFKDKALQQQNGVGRAGQQKEVLELQQLALQYKKLLESRDFDLRDLDQLQQAEKEIKVAHQDQSRI